MPETNLAIVPQQPLALVSTQWDTPENRALILRTVAPGLTEVEAALFFHVARERHLDPMQKQIYAIKRRTWVAELNGGQGAYEERMVLQVGVDGFRSIANRTGLYMPSDKLPIIEGQGTENLRCTFYVKKFHPVSGQWHEFPAVAYYREFVQTRKDKTSGKLEPNATWAKMPLTMLEKVAEVKALRRGWPEELGGMYAPEELERDNSTDILPPDLPPKQDKTKRELGTLKTSTSPNRGHGGEGMERKSETAICAECRQTNTHTDDCKLNPKNQTKKKTRREQWDSYEGHDPKVHISFDEFLQMTALEKELGFEGKDGDQLLKEFLKREFKVEHRPLIRQDQFQRVLDKLRQEFTRPESGPEEDQGAGEEEGRTDLHGLFDEK